MKRQVRGSNSIYKSVVEITHEYLGPAADRFISRQVRNHLHKEPEKLTRADLSRLVDWIRVTVALLTDDSKLIEEYIEQLQQLSNNAQKAG
jgi:hypothetical protein